MSSNRYLKILKKYSSNKEKRTSSDISQAVTEIDENIRPKSIKAKSLPLESKIETRKIKTRKIKSDIINKNKKINKLIK